ncbi:MAG: xanthine dehydrogenase family protein molybdopterin-binding subunit [Phycisphaerae bacterium]
MPSELIGKPINRVDGRLKVTGAAHYAADARPGGLACAVIVPSPIARGQIETLDRAPAASAPGVLAVLSHENAPKLTMPKADFMAGGIFGESRLPLSDREIHYAGQAIAVVVADSWPRAVHAASLVRATFRSQPPRLMSEKTAPAMEAPSEHFGEPLQYARGDVDAALQAAAQTPPAANGAAGIVRLDATYTTPAEVHNPMEPSATTAVWAGDALTIYDSTQWITGIQAVMAEAFGIPRDQVHIVCPFLGGAFGCKAFIWPHALLAAMAAKVVQRPVRLALSRAAMFWSAGHRPPAEQKLTLVAKRDGRLTAIHHETTHHTSQVNDYVEPCGLTTSRLLYACENVRTPHHLIRADVPPPTFMRAPGETPGLFALESALDELADQLSLDPLELRRVNLAKVHPPTGRPWSSNHLDECYRIGAERFGWKDRKPQPRTMHAGGELIGWGMATATFPGFKFMASASLRLDAGGRVTAASATHDLGTGAYTVFTQTAADALGLPVERVTFELGDSRLRPPRSPAGRTRPPPSTTPSAAARNLVAELAKLAVADKASPLFGLSADALSSTSGRLFVTAEPGRGEPIEAIVKRAKRESVEARGSSAPGPEQAKYAFQSFGAHFCEVRVDEGLGRVRVARHVAVMDVGRVINHKTATSQVRGAVVMGIGQALLERTAWDPHTGRCLNDNLGDYLLPVCADVPDIDVVFIDQPDPHINELGCRGVGEIGITGVAAAIANALFHATGRRIRDLPITLDKLLG